MANANLDILLLAGGLVTVILLVVLIVLQQALGAGRKKVKSKLDRFKDRFNENQSLKGERSRSIRVGQDKAGLGGSLAKLLPRRDLIRLRLAKAGMEPDLARYAITSGVLGFGTLIAMFVIGAAPLLAFFFAIIMGVGLPHMVVSRRIKSRTARFIKQFPEAMDLMVRGLKSGLPVNECITNVASELPAPTGVEFQKVTDGMRLGKQLEEALWETADRLDTPDFKFFVISLVVQRETGGNLGETLGNLATILRQRQAMKLKVKALSGEAKASAWIMGALPFIMLGLIMTMNYDYGIVLFTHPKAIIASIGGLIWMSIGIAFMAKMISFEV
ncbi:MAG: pilus assembly protein TadB [Kordiimonadales bacterium]|nr:MAG: pilus assembly protein TadB [Kordiimonadales bacterium]